MKSCVVSNISHKPRSLEGCGSQGRAQVLGFEPTVVLDLINVSWGIWGEAVQGKFGIKSERDVRAEMGFTDTCRDSAKRWQKLLFSGEERIWGKWRIFLKSWNHRILRELKTFQVSPPVDVCLPPTVSGADVKKCPATGHSKEGVNAATTCTAPYLLLSGLTHCQVCWSVTSTWPRDTFFPLLSQFEFHY